MLVNKHITHDKRLVLAVCDTALAGRKLENDTMQLDLSSDFYNGVETGREQAIMAIRKAYIVNLVGKEAVGCGIDAGAISKNNIMLIMGVPFAQGLLILDK